MNAPLTPEVNGAAIREAWSEQQRVTGAEYEPKIGSAEFLDSLAFEARLSHAVVWARYVERSANFDPATAFEGTLLHLRWALAELEKGGAS